MKQKTNHRLYILWKLSAYQLPSESRAALSKWTECEEDQPAHDQRQERAH